MLDISGSASDYVNRKKELNIANYFVYYLGNSQSNYVCNMCLIILKDGNTVNQQSIALCQNPIFMCSCLCLMHKHCKFYQSISYSQLWAGVFISGQKILISYIGLEKEDVKSAEEVMLITLAGPLVWHQPCHTLCLAEDSLSLQLCEERQQEVELFPNGACVNSGLASEANDNEEVHTF